jgi:MFS family permease
MIRPASTQSPAPPSSGSDSALESAQGPDGCPGGCPTPYGRTFWLAYASNALVCVAIALLYRYADFVTYLGGTEFHLGWIVGVGMVGSVLVRLLLGSGIDRYGPRLIWLGSLVLFVATCWAHLSVTDFGAAWIYVLRILYCTAMAGIFGAATTFIVGRSGGPRLAELISMLGTSGFLGMMLGTLLGDFICGAESLQRWHVDGMFLAAGLLGAAAVPFAWLSTRGAVPPEYFRRGSVVGVVRRYQPGMVLVVGVATGAALVLPATFLRTFAADLDIPRIGLFFSVVAITAFTTRVLTRRLPERLGLPRMILIGLGVMAVAQLLFLLVGSEWQLVLPGLAHGIAQAILYPMVTATESSTFPLRYRGLGTTLVLATLDVGQLIGAPVAGIILHVSGSIGLAGYPTMYLTMSAVLVMVAGLYAVTLRGTRVQGSWFRESIRVAGGLARRWTLLASRSRCEKSLNRKSQAQNHKSQTNSKTQIRMYKTIAPSLQCFGL